MTALLDDITFVTTFDDVDQLAALYAAAQLGRRLPQEILEAFRNSRYRIFALQAGRLVGAGRAFGDEVDCAVICDMAVHPALQGHGLGERILGMLKPMLRHHLRIILYAKPGREGFYARRGFHPMKTAMLCSYRVTPEQNRAAGLIA